MPQPFIRLIAVAGIGLALLGTAPSAARQDATPTNITSIRAAEFFSPTKVWTAHLSMSADAWQAMQPQYGAAAAGSDSAAAGFSARRRPQRRRGPAGHRVRLRPRHAADRRLDVP